MTEVYLCDAVHENTYEWSGGGKKADLLYLSCVRYKNGQAVLQDDMMQS